MRTYNIYIYIYTCLGRSRSDAIIAMVVSKWDLGVEVFIVLVVIVVVVAVIVVVMSRCDGFHSTTSQPMH